MRRVITSLGLIVFIGAVVVSGTGAFFSDTETSTGNLFTAGALDLLVDNHAWYNGLECANVADPEEDPIYQWTDPEGNAVGDPYLESLIGTTCTGTWELSNLDGHLFFDLDDLKPGDWEEDTISLHVDDNPAWMCANLTVTKDDDVDCTEPELGDDANCDNPDLEPNDDNWDGDLGSGLQFVFWLDDGDNVFEDDENVILSGTPDSLDGYGTDDNSGETFAIADSQSSIFGEPGTPVPGGNTFYIGKLFCFGDLTPSPVAPGDENSPALDTGFDCSGELVNNAAQTDSLMGDMSFYIEQSRNNPDFTCVRQPQLPDPILTLEKEVVQDGVEPVDDSAWTLTATGPVVVTGTDNDPDPSPAITSISVPVGDYTLTEDGDVPGFTYQGVICDGGVQVDNVVTLSLGDNVTCTFTNTEDD